MARSEIQIITHNMEDIAAHGFKAICTHNGIFHTDEVFAVALLQLLIPGKDVPVIRTRDSKLIAQYLTDKTCVMIDLGMKLEPHLNNFDHHQEAYMDDKSSFGLIVEYFTDTIKNSFKISNEALDIFTKRLVKPIDEWDNNANNIIYRSNALGLFTLQNTISSFNEKNIFSPNQNMAFNLAVVLAKKIIIKEIDKAKEELADEMISQSLISAGLVSVKDGKSVSKIFFRSYRKWAASNNIKYMLLPIPNDHASHDYMIFTTDQNLQLPKSNHQVFRHKNGHFILFDSQDYALAYIDKL